MTSLVDLLFAAAIVAGVTFCVLGYYSYRQSDNPGTVALFAYTLIFGVGTVITSVVGLVLGPGDTSSQPPWAAFTALYWAVGAVPWLVFTARYSGRLERTRWYAVVVLYLPILGVASTALFPQNIANILVSVVFLYFAALVFAGVFLVIQSTNSYVHLSVEQGIGLSLHPIMLLLSTNFATFLLEFGAVVAVGFYREIGRVPRGRPKAGGFRDHENLRFSNDLTPRVKAVKV